MEYLVSEGPAEVGDHAFRNTVPLEFPPAGSSSF